MKREITNYESIRTYSDFIDYYEIEKVLNNYIIEQFEPEIYSGNLERYMNNEGNEITAQEYENIKDPNYYPELKEFFQYYIISEFDASTISDNTNEVIFYIPEVDIYLWAIDFYGISWDQVKITLNDSND